MADRQLPAGHRARRSNSLHVLSPARRAGRPWPLRLNVLLGPIACLAFLVSNSLAQGPIDPRDVALEEMNLTPPFYVRVDVDRPDRVYRGGDAIQVSVRSERDGYLYLFYCDASQQVTCLFPNQVQQDNFIRANHTIVIPDANSRFRLRVGAPFGREVLKAVVTTQPLKTLEMRTLVKGNFTPLKPRKLKAVFVEVKGATTGNGGRLPNASTPNGTQPPRQWSEHLVQVTTVTPNGSIPPTPSLTNATRPTNSIPPTQPSPVPNASRPNVPARPGTGPKRVGVFIGISKYQDPGIRPLRVADRDAESMAQVMREKGRLHETILLVNNNATLANIQQVLQQRLPAATRPGDLVIIYWSGHGGRTSNLDGSEPDGYDEYLVPYDGRLEPASAIRRTMLLDKTFGRWVQNLDGRKLVVIIDACHSGGQTQGAIKALTANAPAAPFRKFFFATTWKRTKDIGQRETAVLASSRATQVSFERRGERTSVMTHFLIETLRGGSGPVTLKEAADYVIEKVPAFVARQYPGTTQTPVFVDQTTPPVLLRPQ